MTTYPTYACELRSSMLHLDAHRHQVLSTFCNATLYLHTCQPENFNICNIPQIWHWCSQDVFNTPLRIAMSWHWRSSGRHCCHWAYYGLFTVHPWGRGSVDIVINFLAFHPASHTWASLAICWMHHFANKMFREFMHLSYHCSCICYSTSIFLLWCMNSKLVSCRLSTYTLPT